MAEERDKNVQVEVSRSGAPQEQFREAPENTYAPLVDIYETEDGTALVAEMPGVSRENVKVEVDKGVLTISGRTDWQEPPEKYARTFVGFSGGSFFRAFALSDEVDRENIIASFANGVLVLKLPKAQTAKPRKIEVRTQ